MKTEAAKRAAKKWKDAHREEYLAKHREWGRNRTYENRRKVTLKYTYGITLEQEAEMLTEQDGKCKICGKSLDGITRCIDHNHTTKKVRGILCVKCNNGLGYLESFIERNLLDKVMEYIK